MFVDVISNYLVLTWRLNVKSEKYISNKLSVFIYRCIDARNVLLLINRNDVINILYLEEIRQFRPLVALPRRLAAILVEMGGIFYVGHNWRNNIEVFVTTQRNVIIYS